MKNSDFIKLVIHCKDCIHRGTDNCPMFIEYWDKYWDEFIVVDHTEDEMFCSEGEKNDF